MQQARFPFTEGSFWVTRPVLRRPALESAARCDVAIIGGGFTGLAAALRLQQRGVDVALLEAEFCGAGASGRNAGHVTPTIGKDAATCIKTFGVKKGLELIRFAEAAIDHFEALVEHRGIACDYLKTGNIIAGLHEVHRPGLTRSAHEAEKLGLHLRFLDESEMQARGIPPAFRFGVLEARGGTINSGKYIIGLRDAAIRAGVRIFEDSPVTEIRQGAPVSLRTARGELRAEKVLLATNAYTPPRFSLLKNTILPVRVTLFATRPLTEDELAGIGWRGREGIYTAHEILESYRLTVDRRIIGGSKTINYEYGSALAPGYQPEAFALLERTFRERFPTLAHVPVELFWGGWIALTLDFLPVWGRLGKQQNILYYSGCNGHGIPQCTMMGEVMADELLGERSPWAELLRRFIIPLPPEPLRAFLLDALNWWYARIDRRVDRDLRAGRVK